MSVDAATVRRIAHLARIAVADGEVEHLRGEINAILAFVEQLSEVDVAGVEPMTSVTPMAMKKRQDEVTDGGIADAIVANAPATEGPLFPRSEGGGVMCLACEEEAFYRAYLDAHGQEGERRRQPRTSAAKRAAVCDDEDARKPDYPTCAEGADRVKPSFACDKRMTELTALTHRAGARRARTKKSVSAAEIADAHLDAIEKARALNAYVLETPEIARAMAKASDAPHRGGQGRAAGRHSDRREGPVLHQGRAHDRVLAHPRQFHARPMNRPSPRSSGATAR